ncbi:MAG TPA: ABC transporter ATP-binding protein [Dehalococcoidia bacterium]|nr:ABC transporter ATP-binding protein [Dehalococcoidia bacterium]
MSAPLELTGVRKVYGHPPSEVVAVDDVTLAVPEGRVVVVLGPSGSGKTTLLSIAGCLLSPTEGSVRIVGNEVTSMSERQLPAVRLRHIGFVFQTFNLLDPLTALENVLMPMNLAGRGDARARSRARELLVELGLEHRVGSRPAELSAGERQRVAIARALANEPALVLADEPTANLDSASGQRVMRLLSGLVRAGAAKALVVVTHDQRVLEFADETYWMEDGRLRRDGSLGVAGAAS